jgi:hypothetical protein
VSWLARIIRGPTRTPSVSRSDISRSSQPEFTWPPVGPIETYEVGTSEIVSLSPDLSGAATRPRKSTAWKPDAWARREVLWLRKLSKPFVATLTLLAIVETAYLAVHLARERRKTGATASGPQTTASAAVVGPVTSPPSPTEVAAERPTAVDAAPGDAEVEQAPIRKPPARGATREESPPTSPASAPGWFFLSLPIRAQIFEKQQLVGWSDGSRVMLAAGRHDLELVNESLGYRERRSILIHSGSATPLAVALPDGRLQVNAVPWSEVLIDGERIGLTPLGNLRLAIGPHRVLFRHPQLGEVTRTAVIVAGASTRLSVDFTK